MMMMMRSMNVVTVALLVFVVMHGWAHAGKGGTDPEQFMILVDFRDAMLARGGNWSNALKTWTCPTNPENTITGECDPCGAEVWGNWKHIACRGDQISSTKWEVPGNGLITNVHITDYNIEGTIPLEEACKMSYLREFDFDGGKLEGSIPDYFHECFPDLKEIDLSYNRLSGKLPENLEKNEKLQEFKVENNALSGTIPDEYAMPSMAWFRFAKNRFTGSVPESFAKTSPKLNQLTLDDNDFSGNLYPLAKHRMTSFTAHQNPKLCGMVPVGLRFAHGFNYYQTGLGLPCPDEIAAAKGK